MVKSARCSSKCSQDLPCKRHKGAAVSAVVDFAISAALESKDVAPVLELLTKKDKKSLLRAMMTSKKCLVARIRNASLKGRIISRPEIRASFSSLRHQHARTQCKAKHPNKRD